MQFEDIIPDICRKAEISFKSTAAGKQPIGMNTPLDSIYMAGISHKNAPISIRERLTLQEESCKHFLSVLQNSDSIQEAVILSTCNRTEL
ncbi:MAG: hypothetical protein MI741_01435, partial [Rhodospirillales bacterium]|nr:hypothetical protein [Rhodospirillales bacterium]